MKRACVLFCVGLAFLAPACGGRKNPAAPASPAGDRPARAIRIVSLIPSATAIVYALGAGDGLVGVTRYCKTPDKARAVPKVGGILDVSLEAVAAVRPDLVIGSPGVLKGRFVDILGAAGVKFLPLDFEDLDDVRDGIAKIGDATGRKRQSAGLLADFDASLEALNRSGTRPRVLFVVGTKPLVVASNLSFQGQLLNAMGLENVVVSAHGRFPTWSLEQVIKAAPDVIIDGIVGGEPSASLLSEAGIKAPVVRIPDEGILVPGPEAVDSAARLGPAVRAAVAGEGAR
jgi:iron complex transport system substrate-binding protein